MIDYSKMTGRQRQNAALVYLGMGIFVVLFWGLFIWLVVDKFSNEGSEVSQRVSQEHVCPDVRGNVTSNGPEGKNG